MTLDGELVANSVNRYGFTSQEIVRRADGSFEIVVAPRASPGNWLPTGGIERYVLVLRLLRHAGRRLDQGRPRSADARDQRQELPMIRWLLLLLGGRAARRHRASGDHPDAAAHRDAGRLFAAGADCARSTRSCRCRCRRRTRRADAVHGSGLRQRGLPLRSFARSAQAHRAGQPRLYVGVVLYAQRHRLLRHQRPRRRPARRSSST